MHHPKGEHAFIVLTEAMPSEYCIFMTQSMTPIFLTVFNFNLPRWTRSTSNLWQSNPGMGRRCGAVLLILRQKGELIKDKQLQIKDKPTAGDCPHILHMMQRPNYVQQEVCDQISQYFYSQKELQIVLEQRCLWTLAPTHLCFPHLKPPSRLLVALRVEDRFPYYRRLFLVNCLINLGPVPL